MIWKVVKPPLWTIFRLVSRFYLVLSKREYRYVFILGHVRSGSTLLAHILANHPNFVRAGESHISYQTADDLPKLVLQTCISLHRPILRETYVVEQINHPYVTNEVLLSGRVYKCIILIREPEATLKSIMKLLKCQEREALDVYISRLEALGDREPAIRKFPRDNAANQEAGNHIKNVDSQKTASDRRYSNVKCDDSSNSHRS